MKVVGGARFEVIDALCAEFDGEIEAAEAVELVGVEAYRVVEGDCAFEEAAAVGEGPGALFAECVDRDGGKFGMHGGERFIDDRVDKMRLIGIDCMAKQGGGDDGAGK